MTTIAVMLFLAAHSTCVSAGAGGLRRLQLPFNPPWNDEPSRLTDWATWCAFELNEGCYACENQQGAARYCRAECAAAGCPGFDPAPTPAPSPPPTPPPTPAPPPPPTSTVPFSCTGGAYPGSGWEGRTRLMGFGTAEECRREAFARANNVIAYAYTTYMGAKCDYWTGTPTTNVLLSTFGPPPFVTCNQVQVNCRSAVYPDNLGEPTRVMGIGTREACEQEAFSHASGAYRRQLLAFAYSTYGGAKCDYWLGTTGTSISLGTSGPPPFVTCIVS